MSMSMVVVIKEDSPQSSGTPRKGGWDITGEPFLPKGACVELGENYFFLSPELVPCLCKWARKRNNIAETNSKV